MPFLMARVLSRRRSSAAISPSMSAMAVCSSTGGRGTSALEICPRLVATPSFPQPGAGGVRETRDRTLGPIRLEPTRPDIGKPYYVAKSAIDTTALLAIRMVRDGPDEGSNSLRWWRRRESNPRPKIFIRSIYMLVRFPLISLPSVRSRQGPDGSYPLSFAERSGRLLD